MSTILTQEGEIGRIPNVEELRPIPGRTEADSKGRPNKTSQLTLLSVGVVVKEGEEDVSKGVTRRF